jgi:hypothetical protein
LTTGLLFADKLMIVIVLSSIGSECRFLNEVFLALIIRAVAVLIGDGSEFAGYTLRMNTAYPVDCAECPLRVGMATHDA